MIALHLCQEGIILVKAVSHYGSLHVVPPGEDVTLYTFALYMLSDHCANPFNLSKGRFFVIPVVVPCSWPPDILNSAE